ncbi:MAG: hypothetical protein U0236_05455 [Nitrospira sp.]
MQNLTRIGRSTGFASWAMPSSDEKKVQEARANARRLIEQGPKVLIGLFAMTGVAYLAGSVYTRSYFAEFGASWILEEVPTAIYFGQSWIPLLLMLFVGYLATTNLVHVGSQRDVITSTRFKISRATVRYGPWLLGGFLAIIPLLSSLDYVAAVIGLSLVAIPLLLFLLASALELLVVRFSKVDRSISLSTAYLSFAVIAVALYVVPAELGMNRARLDKQEPSSLLTVYLRDENVMEHKLLFVVGEWLYVFPSKYEGSNPPVKRTAAARVTFVPPES